MIVSSQSILRKASKVGEIDCHRAEETHNNVEASESRIGSVHVGRCHLGLASDQLPSTVGDDCRPKEQSKEGRWYDDSFDKEQDSELLDGHESQDGLKNPIDEEGQQPG